MFLLFVSSFSGLKLARSREVFFGLKLIYSRVLMRAHTHTHTLGNGDYIVRDLHIIFKRGFKLISSIFRSSRNSISLIFLLFLPRCLPSKFQINCDSFIPAQFFNRGSSRSFKESIEFICLE